MQIVPTAPHRWLTLILLLVQPLGKTVYAQAHDSAYEDVDPWAGVKPLQPAADSAAVAGFFKALASADPVVCQFVAHAIGNNWNNWDTQYHAGSLKAEAASERTRQSLSRQVTDHGALAHLAEALSNPQPCVRRAAARMLGQTSEPDAVRLLRDALKHQSPIVREAAALGLADAEDPAAYHDLTRALRDREPAVTRMAAYALGELEDARAVKPLR